MVLAAYTKAAHRRAAQKGTDWAEEIVTAARTLRKKTRKWKVAKKSGEREEIEVRREEKLKARKQFKVIKSKAWQQRDEHLRKRIEDHLASLDAHDQKGDRDPERILSRMQTLEKMKQSFRRCKQVLKKLNNNGLSRIIDMKQNSPA